MTPEQQVSGPLSSLAGYGAAGAVAAVLLLTMLYTFKRLFDRVLEKGDKSIDQANTTLVDLRTVMVEMKNALVDEIRDLRHEMEGMRMELRGRVENSGRVVEAAEREPSVSRRR